MSTAVERRGRIRCTKSQLHKLTSFMETYPQLNRGIAPPDFTTADRNRLWRELTEILNADGEGPVKPVVKWQKCWRDCKLMIKKMYLKNLQTSSESQRPLTSLDKRILVVMGLISNSTELVTQSIKEIVEASLDRHQMRQPIEISSFGSVKLKSTPTSHINRVEECPLVGEVVIKMEPSDSTDATEAETPAFQLESSQGSHPLPPNTDKAKAKRNLASKPTVDEDGQCLKSMHEADLSTASTPSEGTPTEGSCRINVCEAKQCSEDFIRTAEKCSQSFVKSNANNGEPNRSPTKSSVGQCLESCNSIVPKVNQNSESSNSNSAADAIFALAKELGVKNQLYKRQLELDESRLELEKRKVMAIEKIANSMPLLQNACL